MEELKARISSLPLNLQEKFWAKKELKANPSLGVDWEAATDADLTAFIKNEATKPIPAANKEFFKRPLPPLGPKILLSSSSRKPSNNLEDQEDRDHKAVDKVIQRPFPTIDFVPVDFASNIYTRQSQGEMGYARESGLRGHVEAVLKDVKTGVGLRDVISVESEIQAHGLRPDESLICKRRRIPVGNAEVKEERHEDEDDVMEDRGIIGQVFNYLLFINSFQLPKNFISVLTTYNHWRFFWLMDQDDWVQAETEESEESEESKPEESEEELESEESSEDELWGPHKFIWDPSDQNSIWHIHASPSPKNFDEFDRRVYASEIYTHKNVLPKLATFMLKVSKIQFKKEINILDSGRTYLLLQPSGVSWTTLGMRTASSPDEDGHLTFNQLDHDKCSEYLLTYFLGSGKDSTAVWLALGKHQHFVVIKDFKDGTLPEKIQTEADLWRELWGLNAVVSRLNNELMLIMPFIKMLSQTQTEERKVEVNQAIEHVAQMGYTHADLSFRHIGEYIEDGEQSSRIVFVDLSDVKKFRSASGRKDKTVEAMKKKLWGGKL